MFQNRKALRDQLIADLRLAEASVRRSGRDRPMLDYGSPEEFADFIGGCRASLANRHFWWFKRRKLQFAFLPTGDWDDCVGDAELGNRVYEGLLALYGWFL